MSGTDPEGRDWTLVFVQDDGDAWFVRVEEYPGVGQALAWDRPLVVEDTLTRRVVTIVADGRLDHSQAPNWPPRFNPRFPGGSAGGG
jgi:hypothetical protein